MYRLLLLTCVVGMVAAAPAPLKWPDQYTVEGSIVLPYGDINEPFKAVVDMTKGMSYFSTYDGMATVINRADMGTYGTMFKTVPETTYDFANKMTCFKIPGAKEASVTAQSVLPDLSNYVFVSETTYKGKSTNLYTSYFNEGNKNNNYSLMIGKDDGNPVLLYFLGYDRLIGSHYDEYVIMYDTFSTSVDSSVFNVSTDDCVSFPGPGVTVPMAENPMFEFVGAKEYSTQHQTHNVDSGFEKFKSKYDRKYQHEVEETQRKVHFRHNHRYIESMNRKDLSYKLKVNHLADLSDGELKRMRGYRHTQDSPRGELYKSNVKLEDVPSYYNWWLRGAVTPVKDQGICGSCWSFGTTGTIEGSYFIKHGNLVAMSEQSLIDCSWGEGNNGCDGGESERAYRWIISNGCIPTEKSYNGGRYLMEDGYCQANSTKCGAVLTKFYNTPSGDVSALVSAIYEKGPISVAIDASHKSFSFYSHGVYFEPECGNGEDDLDHQVLAVGFGMLDDEPGKEFYLIKNSWSTHWGMDGYVLMSRINNNCGVATDASYADVM